MKKLGFLLAIVLGVIGIQMGFTQKEVLAQEEEGMYIETQEEEESIEHVEQERICFENTPIRIASFSTNPPFGWVEKTGFREINDRLIYWGKGFNVDFIKKIGEELKIAIDVEAFTSDAEMMEAFQDGGVDIIVGAYYDPKMKAIGHGYVIPSLIQNVITVVFMKGKEKDIKRFEDLIGMKGVVRYDEQFYQYVRLMIPEGVDVEVVRDSRAAFTKLITGEADYMLTSPYSAEAEARRFKLNTNISVVPIPLLGQELFLLVSRKVGCPDLVNEIAHALREKRKDMHAMKRELINYIDTWGQRFKNDPGLIDQLKKEGIGLKSEEKSEEESTDELPTVEPNQEKEEHLSDPMDMQ